MSADCPDLYAALEAEPCDSLQQLKHKYQQLALQNHPDRLAGLPSSEAESCVRRFLEADAAWRILREQDCRRQYDLSRRAKQLQQDWPVDSVICLEDMTFDPERHVYTHPCRCGGHFTATEEELGAEPQGAEPQGDDGGGGVVLCCDTCSLSVHVTG